MRFLNVLALASAASASAIEMRQESSYYVSKLRADCIADSNTCVLGFEVSDRVNKPGFWCGATEPASHAGNVNKLGPVNSATCDDSRWSWSAYRTRLGYYHIKIVFAASAGHVVDYCINLAPRDLSIDSPTNTEHYIGQQSFVVGHDSCRA